MIKQLICIAILMNSLSCIDNDVNKEDTEFDSRLIGTWKMIHGEILENDSLQIKDLSKSSFIKIINGSHFAFFNQEENGSENFYGGAGTYTLNGDDYVETLEFISVTEIRGHEFPFKIKIKGDTLIQFGIEDVKEAGVKREIVEKYIKIKS